MKNGRSIKRFFYFIPLVLMLIIIVPVLNSCSWLFFSPSSFAQLQKAMKKSSQIEWISKRSFSLKFVSSVSAIGFGTGWIFGKNKDELDKYYIATNMHVASFLQNQNKIYQEASGNRFINKKGLEYSQIQLGIVGDKQIDGSISIGTDEPLRTVNDDGIHFITSIPVSNTKIVFSGFDVFNSSKDKNRFVDPFNIRGDFINNAAIDLAIIEMDLSSNSRHPINNYSDDIMDEFLDYYDDHETKFATTYGENFDDNIHLAGFPYDNEVLNPSSSTIGSNKHKQPIWVGASDIKRSQLISALSLTITKPGVLGDNPLATNQTANNEIVYVTDEFASYRNVALQGLFEGIDLGGGSSGSLVINDNYEVIGIYWGVYKLKVKGKTVDMGGIDYFITRMHSVNVNNKIITSWDYNILKEVQEKIGNSLKTPVWKK